MKIELTIPDEVAESYEAQSKRTESRKTLKAELEDRLIRFKDVPRDDRFLVIQGEDRKELEKIFQTTIESPKRLLAQIRNMGAVKIGTIERVFTPDELIRLHDQAVFHGWTDDDYMRLTVDEALNYIFERM